MSYCAIILAAGKGHRYSKTVPKQYTLFDNEFINYAITFFWVVGMMNSINMLDNMDGITTSVSIGVISTVLFALVITEGTDNLYFWVLLGTMNIFKTPCTWYS